MSKEMIFLLKSKIHHATVTKTNKYYIGSIFIDNKILKAANIFENEKVEIFNVTNGQRWSTYAVSTNKIGEVSVNGAGARLCEIGDTLIIVSYKVTNEKESSPIKLFLCKTNQIIKKSKRKQTK